RAGASQAAPPGESPETEMRHAMGARDAVTWAPLIAMACGVLAGLGVLYSARRALGLALVFLLVQVAGWLVLLMLAGAELREDPADWKPDFGTSFLLSLIIVAPYTTVATVLAGAAVALSRRFAWRSRTLGEEQRLKR